MEGFQHRTEVGNVNGDIEITRFEPSAEATAEIDAIFFAASATQVFASEAAQAVFRERWLGRYLLHFAEGTYIAKDQTGRVLGYVIGSFEDPAKDPLFSDIAFFQSFRSETARFPAQLHINLAPEARNRGIGGRLIEAFCRTAKGKGSHGVHVVTSATSRNRTFYARQGFVLQASLTTGDGGEIVLLGRKL